jgi:glutaredoxin
MELVVYGKSNCPLCDKAIAAVSASRWADRLRIVKVDIESNSDLMARYRFEIPVLFVDGRRLMHGIVTTAGFEACMAERESSRCE